LAACVCSERGRRSATTRSRSWCRDSNSGPLDVAEIRTWNRRGGGGLRATVFQIAVTTDIVRRGGRVPGGVRFTTQMG
jgi:hypothetical protein